MKILAISDVELPQFQNLAYVRRTYQDVELLVSCGDLPVPYLDYVTSVLNVPLLYVHGNHDISYLERPPGGVNLHKRMITMRGLTFAGLGGSLRYNNTLMQYTDGEMLRHVLGFAPRMLTRRLRRGHGVDVMVTHAPPRGIHDREDRPHMGFKALLTLIEWYRPRYLLHGHIDVFDRRETTWTEYLGTQVVNVDPVRLLTIDKL